jgi:hypothetical protein
MNTDYKTFIFKEKDRNGNRMYSYLVRYEYKHKNVEYVASTARYHTPEEANIAATLIMDKNYLGER